MHPSNLPFEDRGNIFGRWWRNSLYPIRSFRIIWDDIYRGDSLGAPMRFAYLWVLAFIPVLFAAVKIGLSALNLPKGDYSGVDPMTPYVAGGGLMLFISQPFVTMFVGGSVAHGVLCALDSAPQGGYRKSLRVAGYANAWLIPVGGTLLAIRLFGLFSPLSVIGSDFKLSLTIVLLIADLTLLIGAAWLIIWGLKIVHRVSIWKSILAWLVAWVCVFIASVPIGFLGFSLFWQLIPYLVP